MTFQYPEKTKTYYRFERLAADLKRTLAETREEPVFSIKSVAEEIKKVFDKAEVKSLIKELQGR